MKCWIKFAIRVLVQSSLLGVLWTSAHAQVIPLRSDLDALLGCNQIFDDFERFNIPDEAATNLSVSRLDSDTVTDGQGPGLVEPGAVYSDTSSRQLQWNGHHYFGLETKTILASGTGGSLGIDYTTFVQAVGLDLRAFSGFGYRAVIQIYDANGLVDALDFTLSIGGAENVFLGYRHDAGITRAVLHSDNYSWSPIIDNHGYGAIEKGRK